MSLAVTSSLHSGTVQKTSTHVPTHARYMSEKVTFVSQAPSLVVPSYLSQFCCSPTRLFSALCSALTLCTSSHTYFISSFASAFQNPTLAPQSSLQIKVYNGAPFLVAALLFFVRSRFNPHRLFSSNTNNHPCHSLFDLICSAKTLLQTSSQPCSFSSPPVLPRLDQLIPICLASSLFLPLLLGLGPYTHTITYKSQTCTPHGYFSLSAPRPSSLPSSPTNSLLPLSPTLVPS